MKKQTQILPVKLTKQEKESLADQAANNCAKLRSTEAEKKEVMADFKERIDTLNAQIREDLSTYKRGFEDRPVEVRWEMDSPVRGEKSLVRLDTMENVQVVTMTDADKQTSFSEDVLNPKGYVK